MHPKEEKEAIAELTNDLKGGRLTRGAFVQKALAMGVSLTLADRLLESNPAFAMSKAERELRASGKVLQYWTPFAGADGPHMKLMVDFYNNLHHSSGFSYNFVRVGGGYETKMRSAAISRTLPDVAAYRLDWIPDEVARGIFEPIDNIAAQVGLRQSDFAPAVWQGGLQKGHRYSIPLDTHVAVFWYNKDLLRRAGLMGAPKNMTEFNSVITGSKKAGVSAFPMSINWPLPMHFATWLWQNGGSLFSADGNKAAFNSEAGRRALQFMVDLVNKGASPKGVTDEGNIAFLGKKAAMWIDGVWWLQGVKDAHINFGAGPVPTLFERPAAWSGSHQMVLPKKARTMEEQRAIGQFMYYVVTNALEWARGGQVPASARVRAMPAFKNVQPIYTISSEEPYVRFVDPFPGASDAYYPAISNWGSQAINGKIGVAQALAQAEHQANQLLAQAKAQFGSGSGE